MSRFSLRGFGYSLEFDGVNDRVDCGDVPECEGISALSVSFWVRLGNLSGNQSIIRKRVNSGNWTFEVSYNSATSTITYGVNAGTSTSATVDYSLNSGVWYWVCMNYDGSNVYLYVNNVLVSSYAKTGNTQGATTNLFIGSNQGVTDWFKGDVSDVQIYSASLSQTEREGIYYGNITCSGLIRRFKLNEGSGTTATDATGTANGTISGSAVYTTAEPFPTRAQAGARILIPFKDLGNNISFDGSSSYLRNATTSAGNATNNFSAMAWIRPSILPQAGMVLYNGNGSSAWAFGIFGGADGAGSKLFALYEGVAWIDSGYTFPSADVGYHIAMVRNSGTLRFYVNSVQTNNTSSSTPNAPSGSMWIGSRKTTASQYFQGLIDEVSVYSRALSPSEITDAYNLVAVDPTSLVGLWHFSEGSGTTTADSSASGITLTFNGTPTWSSSRMVDPRPLA